ncbi:MAG: Hsp20/alpha crystallin family protein [Bacteroidia bacterium]|nr:Hsp20/alpha crystallin family protein [Bacteroidia bacterium]
MYHYCNTAGSARDCGPAFGQERGHHFSFQRFGGNSHGRRPKYNVPVNIVDKGEAFEIHVYATGFDKSDISLTVASDLLLIRGEKNLSPEDTPEFTRQEFPVKTFERQIALNGMTDTTAISAKQEGGVLIISLPKSPKAKSENQKIDID